MLHRFFIPMIILAVPAGQSAIGQTMVAPGPILAAPSIASPMPDEPNIRRKSTRSMMSIAPDEPEMKTRSIRRSVDTAGVKKPAQKKQTDLN